MTHLPLQTRILALAGLLATAVLLVGTQLVARDALLGDGSGSGARTADASAAPGERSAAAKNAAPEDNAPAKRRAAAPAWLVSLTKSGLPPAVVCELRKHRVVVVSLFASTGAVDRLAEAEARGGARRAGVGFVAVNVRRGSKSRPMAAKVGPMDTPAVLIYRRPARLVVELDGFADLETVVQAAADARA